MLKLHRLKVELEERLPITVNNKPMTFEFESIFSSRLDPKTVSNNLFRCAMQGHLLKRRSAFSFFKISWDSNFFILSNLGMLIFESENLFNPTKLIPLGQLSLKAHGHQIDNKNHVMTLSYGSEELFLAAPDKNTF